MLKTIDKEDIIGVLKKNIKIFNNELKKGNEEMIRTLNFFRQWYYISGFGFGPSKFIAYRKQTADKYFKFRQTDGGMHGWDTENVIKKLKWFKKTDNTKLVRRLESLLEKYGKKPNALSTIHVLK